MIDVGEKVVLTATYRLKATGALADPSTPVKVSVTNKRLATSNYTATRVSEGVFTVEVIPLTEGRHDFAFFTDDDSVGQGEFFASELASPKPGNNE